MPARGRGANPGFLVSKDAVWVRGHGWVFWVGSPGWKSGLPPGSSMQDRVLLRRGHSRRIGKVLGGPAGGGQSQQAPRGPRASFFPPARFPDGLGSGHLIEDPVLWPAPSLSQLDTAGNVINSQKAI